MVSGSLCPATVTSKFVFSRERIIVRNSSASRFRTSMPSMAVISMPALSPALAAGESRFTSVTWKPALSCLIVEIPTPATSLEEESWKVLYSSAVI